MIELELLQQNILPYICVNNLKTDNFRLLFGLEDSKSTFWHSLLRQESLSSSKLQLAEETTLGYFAFWTVVQV